MLLDPTVNPFAVSDPTTLKARALSANGGTPAPSTPNPGTGGTSTAGNHVWNVGDPITGFPGLYQNSSGQTIAGKAPATSGVTPFSFSTPPYTGPSSPDTSFWTNAPAFNYASFQAPTSVTEQNDPGYQFRLSQGLQALQQSAAGQGQLNTGGTLKGIEDYAQNDASQEFQNVYNRALQGYQTNLGTAEAEYAPKFQSWQTQMGFDQADALASFQRAWDAYTFPISNNTQNLAIASSIQPPPPATTTT
jgi:hypothetical protein